MTMDSRRNFLTRTARVTATVALAASPVVAARAETSTCGGLPRADFDAYIATFNTGKSDDYGKQYADDVVLERGALRLEGRKAILDFYRSFHASVRQHITVLDYIPNGDRLAVELLAEFEAFADWSFPGAGSLKKGVKRSANTFVHYNLKDGKFVLIRSARFRSSS